MAGQGRLPPPFLPALGSISGEGLRAGSRGAGPGITPILDGLLPQLLAEEKITTHHAEIQRLITENQRLAATHVALRQELAAGLQEMKTLQQVIGEVQAEKNQLFQALADKTARMEAELRALEPLKVDWQRAQAESQKLVSVCQELNAQLQQLTQEMHRLFSDAQLVPSLEVEIVGLRQEIQHARTACESEKKANTDLLEQSTAMEKNLVSMAREVEKLRAQLTNIEKNAGTGGYAGTYGLEAGYGTVIPYGEGYGMGQIGTGADNGAPFGAGGRPAWGGFDMQRAGARH